MVDGAGIISVVSGTTGMDTILALANYFGITLLLFFITVPLSLIIPAIIFKLTGKKGFWNVFFSFFGIWILEIILLVVIMLWLV